MANENQEIEHVDKTKDSLQIVQGVVQLQTIDDIWRMANMFCQSGLVPHSLDTPQKVVVVLEAGAEHGFKPWQSLQCFHVVNGRLGMEGQAMLAKIRSSNVVEYLTTTFEGKPYEDDYRAIVMSKRINEPVECRTEFSVDDAKRAKLWGAKDNWKNYPKDMLTWRAVSRHSRRYFSDEIFALYTPDELQGVNPVPLRQIKGVDSTASTTERILGKSNFIESTEPEKPKEPDKEPEKPTRKPRSDRGAKRGKKSEQSQEPAPETTQEPESTSAPTPEPEDKSKHVKCPKCGDEVDSSTHTCNPPPPEILEENDPPTEDTPTTIGKDTHKCGTCDRPFPKEKIIDGKKCPFCYSLKILELT